REVEAAMLGFRPPVGLIADLVERLRVHARARNRDQGHRGSAAQKSKGATAINTIFHCVHDLFPRMSGAAACPRTYARLAAFAISAATAMPPKRIDRNAAKTRLAQE